ncbi:MAG: 2-oxoglutarate dehydrogenase E1 component, partial [Acidobacteria bacterium]
SGTSMDKPGPPVFNYGVTLPILLHGDAAFSGQGIVAETLNFSRIPGYRTGGTIHVIANNQLGYTTNPGESRSTLYASDMAKGFEIPIVHVNADDPEACIEAARLAMAYRTKFRKDFLIDLVGYRRYGHNEGDEPTFTQPLMYQAIEQHSTVREIWANTLVQRAVVQAGEPEQMVSRRMEHLQHELEALKAEEAMVEPIPEPPPPGAARRVKTAVPAERLRRLNQALLQVPENFALHRKLERAMQKRQKALENMDEATVDWAMAEEFAFATILEDGIPIRLTGQDVERGTFSHRHATFHDVKNGNRFTALQSIPQAKAAFEVRNSPLSEEAAVGFEYGYNVQEPGRLVIWEAQYGDFINGAQNIIDEFLASARSKWGQTPSLVLLLPHGYEGAGPDHSTGRLERFLALAEETNMRIANCTTSAQYFHLLRRQAGLLRIDPLPLIVMTPKSLLRHQRVHSTLRDLSEGNFLPIIDDAWTAGRPDAVRRIILCSGKIYVDLISSELREQNAAIAIVRVEQLYPFRFELLQPIFDQYTRCEEVIWVQEEPENMGAWPYLQPRLKEFLNGRALLHYVGRRGNASPAEGSAAWHTIKQNEIIRQAFNLESHREINERARKYKLVEK